MKKYLLSKQCGVHRYYVKNSEGEQIYFHVDFDGKPFPTEVSNSDLTGLDFSEVFCCGCSWSGKTQQLVKFVK